MLNQSGIKKTTGGAPNQILLFPQLSVSMGVVIDDAIVSTADENGRKIAKAGTPLYGDLNARTTAFVKATTTPAVTGTLTVGTDGGTIVLPVAAYSNAVGVLLHDVDVTNGDANATLLIGGYVNTNRLDATTAALITAEVKTALSGKVTFIAG